MGEETYIQTKPMVETHVKSGSTTEGQMIASLIVLTMHTLFKVSTNFLELTLGEDSQ